MDGVGGVGEGVLWIHGFGTFSSLGGELCNHLQGIASVSQRRLHEYLYHSDVYASSHSSSSS